MLIATSFATLQETLEYIKKFLAEMPMETDYNITLNSSDLYCYEDTPDWEDMAKIVKHYLGKLQEQFGKIVYDDVNKPHRLSCGIGEQDIADWQLTEHQIYINDGFVVIENDEAIRNHDFPIVVVKKGVWSAFSNEVCKLLSNGEKGDFTEKISPAVYVELVSIFVPDIRDYNII